MRTVIPIPATYRIGIVKTIVFFVFVVIFFDRIVIVIDVYVMAQ